MKAKKHTQVLSFNRVTISNLNVETMESVKGGMETRYPGCTLGATCPVTNPYQCETIVPELCYSVLEC